MSTTALRAAATGKAAPNPLASFSSFMDKFKPQLALALPKHLTADRMARLALTAFSTTPALQKCDPRSIAAAVHAPCAIDDDVLKVVHSADYIDAVRAVGSGTASLSRSTSGRG